MLDWKCCLFSLAQTYFLSVVFLLSLHIFNSANTPVMICEVSQRSMTYKNPAKHVNQRKREKFRECLQHCFSLTGHIRWECLLHYGAVWPLVIRHGCGQYLNICGLWQLQACLLHRFLSWSPHLDTVCCACVVNCFTMFAHRNYYSQQAVTHKANIWFHCSNRVIQFRLGNQSIIVWACIHSSILYSLYSESKVVCTYESCTLLSSDMWIKHAL